jgi:TolB-like protein/DNA-binding winged helix-turn-helix (wHTH) protein
MDKLGSLDSLIFEGLRFDRAAGCLYRTNGSEVAEPLELGSRALAVLALLVERQGQLVSKDAIFAAVWPGIVVGDGNLAVQISALRRVLDHGRAQGSCIQTIPGRGYRFVAPVTGGDAVAAPAARGSGNGSVPFATDDQPEPRPTEPGTDAVLPTPVARRSYRLWRAVIAAVIGSLCLAATIGAGVNSGWFSRENVLAPRLSIVVLPFTNLSNDPAQQYFVDGVTENLTTDLSRIADSFVISRNTAFTYRNKPVNTKQIGHELGVRYVLEGSIQRSGNRVHVNTQLIDAETDAHLWAERFDGDTGDLFALQDEITSRISVALNLELTAAEAARPTDHPDALGYILRGRHAVQARFARFRCASDQLL